MNNSAKGVNVALDWPLGPAQQANARCHLLAPLYIIVITFRVAAGCIMWDEHHYCPSLLLRNARGRPLAGGGGVTQVGSGAPASGFRMRCAIGTRSPVAPSCVGVPGAGRGGRRGR